ncbi:hypothetical protein GCM10027037_03430 [Mucilaginibacter koreensis]
MSDIKRSSSKQRAEKYEPKLAINGTFEQAVGVLFKNADSRKAKEAKEKKN